MGLKTEWTEIERFICNVLLRDINELIRMILVIVTIHIVQNINKNPS